MIVFSDKQEQSVPPVFEQRKDEEINGCLPVCHGPRGWRAVERSYLHSGAVDLAPEEVLDRVDDFAISEAVNVHQCLVDDTTKASHVIAAVAQATAACLPGSKVRRVIN